LEAKQDLAERARALRVSNIFLGKEVYLMFISSKDQCLQHNKKDILVRKAVHKPHLNKAFRQLIFIWEMLTLNIKL
jgi:hypothetical protein